MDNKELLREFQKCVQAPDANPRNFFDMIRENSVCLQTMLNGSSDREIANCSFVDQEVQCIVEIIYKVIQPMAEAMPGISKVTLSHSISHLPCIIVQDSNNAINVFDIAMMLDRSTPVSLNEALEFESIWGECASENGFIDRVCNKLPRALSTNTTYVSVDHIRTR